MDVGDRCQAFSEPYPKLDFVANIFAELHADSNFFEYGDADIVCDRVSDSDIIADRDSDSQFHQFRDSVVNAIPDSVAQCHADAKHDPNPGWAIKEELCA